MVVFIAAAVLVLSIMGMLAILVSKIPELKKLELPPVSGKKKYSLKNFLSPAQQKNKLKKIAAKLPKPRLLLKAPRKKQKRENPKLSDDYWEKIRRG
jgi:hypothetical protein